MGKLTKLVIGVMAVLLPIISSLGAATLEATYTENLNPIMQDKDVLGLAALGGNSRRVGFRVGTMTINAVGGGDPPELKEIKLNRSDADDDFKLVSSQSINGEDEFEALLVAKITYCGTTTKIIKINDDDGKKLLKRNELESCSNPYPITIEFFVLIQASPNIIGDASDVEGIGFQFEEDDTIGNFQVEATDSSNDVEIINTNGDPGFPPFFTTDYSEDSGNDFVNEINYTWDASLLIDQSTTGTVFDLYDLCSSTGTLVGVASITLDGYSGFSEYHVSITFEDFRNGNGEKFFYLKHSDLQSFIPFTLSLQGLELHNGQASTWNGLEFPPSPNQKDIRAKADSQTAQSRVAGEYSDIIYVTIST